MRSLIFSTFLLLGRVSMAWAQTWTWTLVPYAIAPSIGGDTSLDRLEDAGLAVDPADIIEVLEGTFMGYFDGLHSSGWGFTLDYSFMGLADSGSFASGASQADARIFQGILTVVVYHRMMAEADRSLDLYGGLRWWNMDVDVAATFGPVSRSVVVTPSWIDPHIGARYQQKPGVSDWSFSDRQISAGSASTRILPGRSKAGLSGRPAISFCWIWRIKPLAWIMRKGSAGRRISLPMTQSPMGRISGFYSPFDELSFSPVLRQAPNLMVVRTDWLFGS